MTRRGEGGFTLIEVILGLTVMIIMVTAVSQLFVSNLQTLTLSKARGIGLALANEKMEDLRDLPYDSLATQFGAIFPPGLIADDETVTRNNYKFRVHTTISYVDDPYDGNAAGTIVGKPTDLYPYDYKKAQISVYLATDGRQVATLTTDLAGKAAETASNTGILSITVLDANGQPVAGANVHITNTTPNPDVDITTTTDNNGLVVIPKLPPDSANRYQVTATLPGYSTDGTIPDPAGSQTAVQLNPNVLVQQITSLTLSIDRISTLYVHVTDTSGNPVANLPVTTIGAKTVKTNPTVNKYSASTNTDASGNITLSNMEWDAYNFAVPSGYHIVSSSPYAPAALQPNSATTVNLVVSTSGSYPTIVSAAPTSSQTGNSAVALTINGTNLQAGTTVKLQQAGQPDIIASGVTANGSTLTGSLNLTSAASGAWNIVVTSGGNSATQTGGFSVTP